MAGIKPPAALPPAGEREFMQLVERRLRTLLPDQWRVDVIQPEPDRAVDAVVQIQDPSEGTARVLVRAKRSVVGRDVESLTARLRRAAAAYGPDTQLMVVSRFLPELVRDALTAQGINYVDATGNLRLASQHPAVFVRDVGADRDPWRPRGRPRGSLRGRPAALVVRALVDFKPPYSVPELVRLSGSSNGATYRIVEFLDEQALVRRDNKGRINDVSWRGLLELWSRDYGFYTTNPMKGYLAARGIERVVEALRSVVPAVVESGPDELDAAAADGDNLVDGIAAERTTRYVITGSFAAGALAPYAPTRSLALYADDRDDLSRRLGLRETEVGANVMIAQAAYDAVFRRRREWQGVWVTAPSQTAVDLMTGPGRNPAEAEELLDWMERDEPAWRATPS